jgi:hypothetical protein
MFRFDKNEIGRAAVAAIGAVALTTTFVGAAVAPASVTQESCAVVGHVGASQCSDLANA